MGWPENCQIMAKSRTFVSPLGKHLSDVMYGPKFPKQVDKEGNKIKRKKNPSECQKADWAEMVASCANQRLSWQLFSVWTVQIHHAGRLWCVARAE